VKLCVKTILNVTDQAEEPAPTEDAVDAVLPEVREEEATENKRCT